jgi:pimeloyl-ACP methyl ester carboxylesterase
MTTAIEASSRAIELPGRVTLDVLEVGDPSGTPVVFLHGITDSWRSFALTVPELPDNIRTIAISQRGHGDSERPAAGYRTRDFADDVHALLDTLGIEGAVVVGHSMGSTVARRFAVDHPDRIRGLVIASSFDTFAGKPEVSELSGALEILTDPIDADFVRGFQESTIAQPVRPSFFETVVSESCKVPVRVFRGALAGLVEDDVSGDLGQISAPTLVVWGDQDAYCSRADQDGLLAAIPNARLSVYAGTGHAPQWEQPARFARELAEFIAQLD